MGTNLQKEEYIIFKLFSLFFYCASDTDFWHANVMLHLFHGTQFSLLC